MQLEASKYFIHIRLHKVHPCIIISRYSTQSGTHVGTGKEGAAVISMALAHNTILQTLGLGFNRLGEGGAFAVVKMLTRSCM